MTISRTTSSDRAFIGSAILATSLSPLNSTLISVSLVLIADSMDVPPSHALWLIGSYYITSAIAQPLLGSLADRVQTFPLFVGGIALMCTASLVGGTGQNLATLVCARVALAVGTAATYPATMVMVRARFPGRASRRALSVLAAIAVTQQISAAIGPPLGGLLVGAFGWRASFLANIPLALAALLTAVVARRSADPHERNSSEDKPSQLQGFDPWGAVLFAVTLGALFVTTSGSLLPRAGSGAILVAGLIMFCVWESRHPAPLLNVRLLVEEPVLGWIFLRFFVAGVIYYSMLLLWPQWLQQARGISVEHVGLILIPMSVLAPLVAATVGRRWQFHRSLLVGHTGMLVGSCGLLMMRPDSSVTVMVLCSVSFALPTGLLQLGNQAAVYESAPPDQTGTFAGFLRSFWYLGAIIASALGGLLFQERATTQGLQKLAIAMTICSAVIVLVDAVSLLRARAARKVGTS